MSNVEAGSAAMAYSVAALAALMLFVYRRSRNEKPRDPQLPLSRQPRPSERTLPPLSELDRKPSGPKDGSVNG
jgi:hypothetical protein